MNDLSGSGTLTDEEVDIRAIVAPLDESQRLELRRLLQQPKYPVVETIALWLFGTVVISAIPVAAQSWGKATWFDAIYNGELILVALSIFGAAITGAALMDELYLSDARRLNTLGIFAGGVFFAWVAATRYSEFAGVIKGSANSHSESEVSAWSYALLAISLLIGFAHAIALGTTRKRNE